MRLRAKDADSLMWSRTYNSRNPRRLVILMLPEGSLWPSYTCPSQFLTSVTLEMFRGEFHTHIYLAHSYQLLRLGCFVF